MIEKILTSINLDSELSTVKIEQDAYLKVNKKYKQIKPIEKDGLTKEVHEYVCPDGSVGYQIIFRKFIDKKEYAKVKAYGKEKDSRSRDWCEVINDLIIN